MYHIYVVPLFLSIHTCMYVSYVCMYEYTHTPHLYTHNIHTYDTHMFCVGDLSCARLSLSLFVNICMYVCRHTCVYTYECTHTPHTRTHNKYTYTQMFCSADLSCARLEGATLTHAVWHIDGNNKAVLKVPIFVCVSLCMYVCIHTCMYVYIHVCR